MDRYKHLMPRLPQDNYMYAIVEQLVEINKKLDKLILSELPVENKSEVVEKKVEKKTRKKPTRGGEKC